jgi:glucose/arabinose dehydrogenase
MNARLLIALGCLVAVAGCSKQLIEPSRQYGANPHLPEPHQYLLPPMGVSAPVGWKNGAKPSVPEGFAITPFATGLHSPRNVLALADGDVLVVESGGPGIEPVTRPKDIVFGIVIGKAHGPTKPGNRVLLLRDTDRDGRADVEKVLIDKLDSPFGIVALNDYLYVAETGALMRYPFPAGADAVGPGVELTVLPKGTIDHHWTKSLAASPDGSRLYVGVGSNSNIIENGLEAEQNRAAIFEVHPEDGAMRLYAGGLRNPNGLTFNPESGQLWCVVNERDELGNDLVPDYMTSVKPGAFYGWPWSYYGQHVDVRVVPRRPDMVKRAIPADYSLSSHVAPLGLVFESDSGFPAAYRGGAFIGEHGSWDREKPNGYQVAFVPFADGKPNGPAKTFVGGFIDRDGKVHGRPVGVAFDPSGALLVADDTGNAIWRVTPLQPAAEVSRQAPNRPAPAALGR